MQFLAYAVELVGKKGWGGGGGISPAHSKPGNEGVALGFS